MTYFKRFSLTRSFKPCVTKVFSLIELLSAVRINVNPYLKGSIKYIGQKVRFIIMICFIIILSTFLVCPGKTSEIRRLPRNQSRSLQRSKRQTFSAPILDYTKFRKDLARSKMMDRMNLPGTSLHDLYRKEQRVRKNK